MRVLVRFPGSTRSNYCYEVAGTPEVGDPVKTPTGPAEVVALGDGGYTGPVRLAELAYRPQADIEPELPTAPDWDAHVGRTVCELLARKYPGTTWQVVPDAEVPA